MNTNIDYANSSTASYSKSSIGMVDFTGIQMMSPLNSTTGSTTFTPVIFQPMWIVGEKQKEKPSFKFDWAGGLSELKGKINSVDLAHESLTWR